MNYKIVLKILFLFNVFISYLYAEETNNNTSPEDLQKKLTELVLPFTKDFNDTDILLKVSEIPVYYSDIKHGYLNMLKHHTQMTKEPLTEEIAKNYRKHLLQAEIEKKVILQEIKKLNLAPASDIVEKKYEEVKSKHPKDSFLNTLELQGLTEDGFKEVLNFDIGVKALLSKIDEKAEETTDEQIETAYKNNLDKFETPAKIQFSVIRIKNADNSEETKNKNLSLIKNIKENIVTEKNTFEYYAKNFSDDIESRKKGGDYGLLLEKDLKEIFEPIKNLKENELSPIYSYDDGFYIAKVTKKEPKKLIPISEVKDQIKNTLKMQSIMKLRQDYLNSLLRSTKIEVIKE